MALSDPIVRGRGEIAGAESERGVSFAPRSVCDALVSSRVGVDAPSVETAPVGAGADCASAAGRQLMSKAGIATKVCIGAGALLVASVAGASAASAAL
ncbi:hypothetical protein [Methylosinus sporium]|uniref:hypothetical protein n=1 Tax=Methylosinus sporium TaxID=428 RepID=UPI00383B44B7